MKKATRILSILVGLMFLFSGFAKSADSAYFSDILTFYGSRSFGWLAPAVIGAELTLGALLLLQIRQKWVAWTSIAFVLIITGGFTYGFLAHGIYNCGCFGHLEILNLSPVLTICRNIVVTGILVFVALKGENEWNWHPVSIAVIGITLLIGGFAIGFTFNRANVVFTRSVNFNKKLLSDIPLGKYITTSPDSTYLVFAFSYSCPYCNQSIGNVSLYEKTHVVDRVIGLALEDSIAEDAFRQFYPEAPFPMQNMPVDIMQEITDDDLPCAFFIRHDSVILQTHKEMFSPRFLNGFNIH